MDKLLDDLENRISKIQLNYKIEIGVMSYNADRDEAEKETTSVCITNAQLMFLHENGATNLPRRPVLGPTIEWANKSLVPQTIEYCIDNVVNNNWSKADVTRELERMCMRMETYARHLIEAGKIKPPLKYRDGLPLLDTGVLMKSITCRLIEE